MESEGVRIPAHEGIAKRLGFVGHGHYPLLDARY